MNLDEVETEGQIKHDILMPRGWKAVPTFPAIDLLPKDKKGFPIPYVAEWSRNDDEWDLDIRNGYAVANCSCVIGEGDPKLGAQCPQRQRECMSSRRCQVCSLPLPTGDEVAFLGGTTINVFWEPALHIECAIYSLQVCPGITRRPGMCVTTCLDWTLYDRFEFSTDPKDNVFVPTGRIPLQVAMGRKAVLTYHGARPVDGTRISASEFLEMHNG